MSEDKVILQSARDAAPKAHRSWAVFLGVSSFLFALQVTRWLSLALWGDAKNNRETVLFFLGPHNGDQLVVFVFCCAAIAALSWCCFALSRYALSFADAAKPPLASLYKAAFIILHLAFCYPLGVLAFSARGWIGPSLAVAFAAVALTDFRRPRRPAVRGSSTTSLYFTCAFLAFLWVWLFPGLHFPLGVDLYHEGPLLGPGSDFLRGKIPFKEMFLDQGLIHNVMKPAAAFWIFGESVASKHLLFALTAPFGYIGLAMLGRACIKNLWGWTATFLLLPLAFPYFPDRHFFSLVSIACWAAHLERPRVPWAVAAGFFAGVQIWSSVEVGVFALSAAALLFLADFLQGKPSRLLSKPDYYRYLAGLLIGTAPVFLYLAYHKALDDFFWATSLRLFIHTEAEGIPYLILKLNPAMPPGQPPLPGLFNDRQALWYAPLMIQFAALAYLACGWKGLQPKKRLTGVLLTGTAVSHFYPALTHPDFEHLSFSAPITVVLGIWLMREFWSAIASSQPARFSFFALRGLHVGLSLTLVWYFISVFSIGTRFKQRMEALPGKWNFHAGIDWGDRLGGVAIGRETYALLQKIRELSSSHDPIVNLTNEGGLIFLADRKNLTRYYNIDVVYNQAMEKEVIAQIDGARQPIVLTPSALVLKNRMGVELADLENCVKNGFKRVWGDAQHAIWVRKST